MAEHQSLRKRINGLRREYDTEQESLVSMLGNAAMLYDSNEEEVLAKVAKLRSIAHDMNLLEVVLWDLTVRDSVE